MIELSLRSPDSCLLPVIINPHVHAIADGLAAQSLESVDPISREDIEAMIEQTVYQRADDVDVARVSQRLAAGGWPLADPPPA